MKAQKAVRTDDLNFGVVKTMFYGRVQPLSKLLFLTRENEKVGMTSSISSLVRLRKYATWAYFPVKHSYIIINN